VPSTITTEPCAISGSKIATIGHRASADYLDGRRRVPLQQPLRSTRTRLGRGGRARGVSIVVTVETERNERIDELVDEDGHLGRLVAELMPPALLGGIDPYGNAMFNWRQLPSLRAELESQLARPEHAPGEHAFLRRVAALLSWPRKAALTHTCGCGVTETSGQLRISKLTMWDPVAIRA